MTARDLDALITALRRLDYTKLRYLSATTLLDNFSITGRSTREEILHQVRANLEEVSPLSCRLYNAGRLYCWLAAPEDALSPWEVYRVNPLKVTLTCFAVHRHISRELGIQGYPQAFVPIATPSRRYACIIVPQTVPTSEHFVTCVCVWDSLNYVAVWAADSVVKGHLRSALASALCGNPDELRMGSYETLESAHMAARYNAMDRQAPS
ncbi:hypothetical protein MTO96_034350 [Rhipicephalus appendiculatus]